MSQSYGSENFEDVISQLRSITEVLDDRAMSMLRAAINDGATKPTSDEKTVIQARRAIEKAIVLLGKV
jgi:hypothetical protein